MPTIQITYSYQPKTHPHVPVPCKFSNSCLTKPLMDNEEDATIIPIPISTKYCEKKCCWVKTIPLRVCKGLTAHKVQGMSIGSGEEFKRAIIHMPEGRMKNIPGLVLVMFTRLKEAADFAIGTEPNSLSMDDFVKLGNTPAYNDRRKFRREMNELSEQTMKRTIDRITALHDATNGNKTFEGGCEFLLRWYRATFPIGRPYSPSRT